MRVRGAPETASPTAHPIVPSKIGAFTEVNGRTFPEGGGVSLGT
jgi:hypothetical protein